MQHDDRVKSHSDLTLEQVLDMVIAIAKVRGDAEYREPMLAVALEERTVTGHHARPISGHVAIAVTR